MGLDVFHVLRVQIFHVRNFKLEEVRLYVWLDLFDVKLSNVLLRVRPINAVLANFRRAFELIRGGLEPLPIYPVRDIIDRVIVAIVIINHSIRVNKE